VKEMARLQDIGEADVVWDLAAGMPAEPKASAKRPVTRRARKAARR
jgi:hypothetical protein